MATVATARIATPNDRVVLHNVSWETYTALRRNLDLEHSHARLTFDGSNLEIMSPSRFHEFSGRFLGRLVAILSLELGIPIATGGSTTFQRADLERGLEPDECFWFAHELQVRDKHDIDLSVDPPPDLAIEIDISPSRLDRPRIYAALQVPEIWRYDGEHLVVELRQSDGTYLVSETSLALPFFPVHEFVRFLSQIEQDGEYLALRAFVRWIREQNFPVHPGSDE
jgi:Uma2 family endonuclease